MKHILLIFHHYRTPEQLGGLRSWHIGTHLVKQGYRVTAIVPGVDTLTGQKHPGLQGKLWCKEVIDNVEVIRVNATTNDRRSKISRAFYYLSLSVIQALAMIFVRDVDIIISTSMPLSSVVFSYIFARLRNIPFVIDVRDLTIDTAIDLGYFSTSILTNFILKIETFIFKRANHLIPVSEGMAQILKTKGINSEQITVVPIGYEGEVYNKNIDWNRDIKLELGLTNKFVVLYAGSLGYVYDIPTILSAAEQTVNIANIVYLFVGDGQRLQDYKEMVHNKNLNCIFLGSRPKLEIPLFCTQSDVGIYPLKGGKAVAALLGNKIFDYLGNGLPVIYSGPEGDVSCLVKQSRSGICVASEDYKTMAEKIMHLYKNYNEVQDRGNCAKIYIQKELTIHAMMSRFEKTIGNIL